MARVVTLKARGPWVLVAETEAERELLNFCEHRQPGTLVLDGAYYPVQGQQVIVPQSISTAGLQRLCHELERAAISHQQAADRRQSFVITPKNKVN